MDSPKRLICYSDQLVNAGLGFRFRVALNGRSASAFLVRYLGQVRAYLNECRHVPVELDLKPGDFYDLSKSYLVCAMHGAYYSPANGLCLGGPCRGQSLHKLAIVEENGAIFLIEDQSIQLLAE